MPKGSDVIAQFLHEQGVGCVFELVGGMIVHLLDSIHQAGQIRIVSMHHEQGAAFAAEGYARITGVPGVAMATSGPGATNLLTGIASCYFDSTPAVFITGQVNRNEMKGDRAIRQMGFQETDIVSLAAPITKAAWQVETPEQLPVLLRRSFELARSGRPGPVLLDVPMDIQRADVPMVDDTPSDEPPPDSPPNRPPIEPSAIDDLIGALRRAERPLVLVGGGVRAARAADAIRELLDVLGVPVVNSLMGVDVAAGIERPSGRDDRELRQPLGEPCGRPVRTSCSSWAAAWTSARPDRRRRRSRPVGRSSTSIAMPAR